MSRSTRRRKTVRIPSRAVRAGEVKSFADSSLSRAIRDARNQLGADAIILEVHRSRGSGSTSYEVLAAPEAKARNNTLRSGRRSTIARLEAEIAALEQITSDLLRKTAAKDVSHLPPDLIDLFATLVDNEVSERLAAALVKRVALLCGRHSGAPGDARSRRDLLNAYLERLLPCSGPIVLRRSSSTVVALVGPTGAGKTTTVAKLAAHFRLRAGASVGLVAADTYRIGAIEQLARYGEMMGVPMQEANDGEQMRRALEDFSSLDLILVDTAGRSHRDKARMNSLAYLIEAASPHEVHLVVSATSQPKNIMAVLKRFSPLGANRLLFTKLDEAACMGAILAGVAKTGLPVGYVTTGQEVPSDIAPATPKMLAELVMNSWVENLEGGRRKAENPEGSLPVPDTQTGLRGAWSEHLEAAS